jgi:hypothetical protein
VIILEMCFENMYAFHYRKLFSCVNFYLSLKIMCETTVLFDLSISFAINSNGFEVVILLTYLYPNILIIVCRNTTIDSSRTLHVL